MDLRRTVSLTVAVGLMLGGCDGSTPDAGSESVTAPGSAESSSRRRRPDEVFRYEISADASTILIDFDIADGGYLYRSEFAFESGDTTVRLGAPRLPQGEVHSDEFLGEQEIYRRTFSISIPYTRNAAAQSAQILLHLRGCNENIGICYPPQDWTATVALPEGPGLFP